MRTELGVLTTLVAALAAAGAQGQQSSQATAAPTQVTGRVVYTPTPSFDLSSIDPTADPCHDLYQFACGSYAAKHPIPADQASTSAFYNLFNVTTQELSGILDKAAAAGAERTPNEQKIGDYYHACMDTAAIEKQGLEPIAPLLKQVDSMSLFSLAGMTGRLQRMGVNVLFSYGEQQDFKDASKQIAYVDQGGLGMPEKDYYLRTGAEDEQLRKEYVAHVTKMLVLAGETPERAQKTAQGMMQFETSLARASLGVTERRDPEKVYHLVPAATVSKEFPMGLFGQFEAAIHSPHVAELNDTVPGYVPALIKLVHDTDLEVLRAYFRYHLLTAFAAHLPQRFDAENFDFYGRKLSGTEQQQPQWKRCSNAVDGGLGEALGQVYVKQYFTAASKQKMLEMVADIEHAMEQDLDRLDWMSVATKVRAKEKLHGIANKIGYPDHWRDYGALTVKPNDAVGNAMRANEFENDRELGKIGQPVDHTEWGMSPPTVNAYYDPSMNDINFPAGILQPNFYDPKLDDAVNYGHIGGVIGHELTHGFDDQGKKFDAKGNLSDWWTPEDTKKFEAKTDCLVKEYGNFIAVDDVHVNGKLTLGENTADNGGLLLAYMAYLERAKQNHEDTQAKLDGYTGPQRFYIAWAQNWCSSDRPESLRMRAQTDPHAPTQFRSNGPIVNQPGFAGAFSCKAGAAMVPEQSCRVW